MRASGGIDEVVRDTLAPNQEKVDEFPVPEGKIWRVLEVGMADVGSPGQPGSSAVFEVDSGTLRVLAESNGTIALRTERDIEGPATVRIKRRSQGGQREVTAWVSGIVFED